MLKVNLLKLYLVTLSAVTLMACGSGNNPSSQAEISGSAVKGQIANGQVELFGVAGGAQQLLDSTVTDAQGDYQLDVPDTYSGPVKLVVTAVAGTTMLCDAPAGCDGVAFGDFVAMQLGTSMPAVLRQV